MAERPHRAAWIATCVVLVVATLIFALGQDRAGDSVTRPEADAVYYYVYLPSLVLDHDLDLTDQYAVTKNFYRFGKAPSGKPGNVFGVGPAVFALPAFALGHGLAWITGGRTDGFSAWETAPVLWLSVAATVAALWLGYCLCRRRLGSGLAAYLGPLVAILGGPVFYYAVRQPGYAHPFATLFATLLIERWDASYAGDRPRSLRTWLVLGAAAGAAVLARPQLVLWTLVLPVAAIDDLRRRGATRVGQLAVRWLAAAAVAVVVIAPQLIAWRSVYGAWYTVPQGDGFMRWDAPAWSEVLWSSRNGLFPWAPLYAPMLIGAVAVVRRHARLVIAMVLGLAGQTVVNGAVWDWWGGGSFGGRRFDSTFILFAFGAAVVVDAGLRAARRDGPRRRIVAGVAAVGFAIGALVTAASVELAMRTSAGSSRIAGGVPAAEVWRGTVGGLRGELAALLSSGSNLVPRLAFAWRHDTTVDAYDQLVGVHYLGEVFPGLNSYGDKVRDEVPVGRTGDPAESGLVWSEKQRARMIDTTARVLFGLNRRTPVTIGIEIRVASSAQVRVVLNGSVVAVRSVDAVALIEVRTTAPERGINELEITAPIGSVISPIQLTAW